MKARYTYALAGLTFLVLSYAGFMLNGYLIRYHVRKGPVIDKPDPWESITDQYSVDRSGYPYRMWQAPKTPVGDEVASWDARTLFSFYIDCDDPNKGVQMGRLGVINRDGEYYVVWEPVE